MKENELKWPSLKDNLRKFQVAENRWLLWKLCLASRFSLYLCVSVYTECLYTYDHAYAQSLFRKVLIF